MNSVVLSLAPKFTKLQKLILRQDKPQLEDIAVETAATYPFEVLRRQLQMQVKDARLNTLATFIKIIQQGGIPALYAGVLPSLLQVLPSAATSYFVYEFMKILLKVE